MKRVMTAVLAVLLLAGTGTAGDIDINPNLIRKGDFANLVRSVGIATAYRAIAPAEPQGLTGFDLGVSASFVDIEAEDLPASVFENAPDFLPVPRIQARKGLPFNIDLGAFYSYVPDSNIRLLGGEIQWALFEGGVATPALALRGHYSTLQGVDDLDLHTYGADVVISKGFAFLTPYAGAGLLRISGSTDNQDVKTALNLLNDEREVDEDEFRVFGGIQISMLLLRLTAEAELIDDLPVYSAKVSLGW